MSYSRGKFYVYRDADKVDSKEDEVLVFTGLGSYTYNEIKNHRQFVKMSIRKQSKNSNIIITSEDMKELEGYMDEFLKDVDKDYENNKIYLVADTHFGHSNIIKYCNRPFKHFAHMDRVLINNWNKVVPEDGLVFHLGDFFLTRTDYQKKIMDMLNGEKILIMGNHDNQSHTKLIDRLGFKRVFQEYCIINDKYILSHRPLPYHKVKNNFDLNIHGHQHREDYGSVATHMCVSVDRTLYKPLHLWVDSLDYSGK